MTCLQSKLFQHLAGVPVTETVMRYADFETDIPTVDLWGVRRNGVRV